MREIEDVSERNVLMYLSTGATEDDKAVGEKGKHTSRDSRVAKGGGL